MSIEIIATGRYVPAQRVTNEELAKRLDTSDEWIRSHTGIGSRHIVAEDEFTSDLAIAAGRSALEVLAASDPELGGSVQAAAESLDLILVTTATADYPGFPSISCIVQNAIGASKAGTMDVGAGCTGFVYALDAATGMLSWRPERRRALVIGSDALTRITDWTDRGTAVLFGDGAGAVVLQKTDAPASGPGARGLLRSALRADGSGAEHLIMKRGGTRYPYALGEPVGAESKLYMNGRAVYTFAVKAVTDIMEKLLADQGIGVDDLAIIVPHQANARIVQAAAKRAGIPEEKFYLNIDEYANTSTASIPIALDELARSGRLKKGDIVMTAGFGAGLTYGGNLIVW